MQELRNERVDIIAWSEDEVEFLIHSLSPARPSVVIMNFDERTATVVVSEDQLSLAIGRQGRNVSLAARLTGWRIDIRTPERLGRLIVPETQSETAIPQPPPQAVAVDEPRVEEAKEGVTSPPLTGAMTVSVPAQAPALAPASEPSEVSGVNESAPSEEQGR
jgi:N utilization substance protein A